MIEKARTALALPLLVLMALSSDIAYFIGGEFVKGIRDAYLTVAAYERGEAI